MDKKLHITFVHIVWNQLNDIITDVDCDCFSITAWQYDECLIPHMHAVFFCCTQDPGVAALPFCCVQRCLSMFKTGGIKWPLFCYCFCFCFCTAFLHSPYQPVYTATKHGVIGFSRSLAVSRSALWTLCLSPIRRFECRLPRFTLTGNPQPHLKESFI